MSTRTLTALKLIAVLIVVANLASLIAMAFTGFPLWAFLSLQGAANLALCAFCLETTTHQAARDHAAALARDLPPFGEGPGERCYFGTERAIAENAIGKYRARLLSALRGP